MPQDCMHREDSDGGHGNAAIGFHFHHLEFCVKCRVQRQYFSRCSLQLAAVYHREQYERETHKVHQGRATADLYTFTLNIEVFSETVRSAGEQL